MFALIASILVQATFASTSTISFVAETNMPGVSVEGEVSEISTQYDAQKLSSSRLEFDVFAMKTGMDKRDQHLREKVFSAKNPGDVKISFQAKKRECSAEQCKLIGDLTIKGITKEVQLPLESKNDKNFSGVAQVSLSEFSLPRPSFMGVQVEDVVKVKFSFQE